MTRMKVPKRIEINGKWYDVRIGWTGKLELYESMKNLKYTADEPYAHRKNYYQVYHLCGRKIGDLHMDYKMCSGAVSNFEG